jgi:hypothetical protein
VGAHGEGPIDFRFIQRNSPPELKPVEGEDAIGNAPVANASAQGYCGEARVCLNAVKMGHRPSMIAAFLRRSLFGYIEDSHAQSLREFLRRRHGACAFPDCQA